MGLSERAGSLESLRERNRLRVVDALRASGAEPRAEIARFTGLSRSTVSTLVADLQAARPRRRARASDGRRARRPGPAAGAAALDRVGRRAPSASTSATTTSASRSPTSRCTVLAERRLELDVDHDAERRRSTSPPSSSTRRSPRPASSAASVLGVGVGLAGPIDQRRARRLRRRSCRAGRRGRGRRAARAASACPCTSTTTPTSARSPRSRSAPAAARATRSTSGLRPASAPASSSTAACTAARRHRRRDRPRARRRDGPDLPLRQPRLPGDAGLRAGDRRAAEPEPRRRPDGRASIDRARRARATPAAAARSPTPAAWSAARSADICNVLNPEMVVVGGDLSAAGDVLLDRCARRSGADALPAAAADARVVAGELGDRAEVLGALALAVPIRARSGPGCAAAIR